MQAALTLRSTLAGSLQVSSDMLGVARMLHDLRKQVGDKLDAEQQNTLSNAIETLLAKSGSLSDQAGNGGVALLKLVKGD